MLKKIIILYFMIMSLSTTIYAQEIFEDTTNMHTIKDIVSDNLVFKKTNKLTYGINNHTYWIKIKIKNNKNKLVEKFILFDFSLLKSIEAYSLEKDGFSIQKNGYIIPINDREVKINDTIFKYELEPYEEKTIYFKTKNDMSNILNYEILDEEIFYKRIKEKTIIEMMILSGLLILFLYNLVLTVILKSKPYFLYLGCLLGTILFFANITNFLQFIEILIPYRVNINIISLGMMLMFSLLFLNEFKTEKLHPFIKVCYKISILISFSFIVVGIINSELLLNASIYFKRIPVLFVILSIVMLLIYFIIKKYELAKFLALGWLLFLIGGIGQLLLIMGYTNNSIFKYGLGFGSLSEAILYSFILAYNYKSAYTKIMVWKDKYLKELKKQNKSKDELLDQHVISSSTDLKGIIIDASTAFCKISGYTKNELIGKNHNIIRHPDSENSIFKDMWETIEKDKIWTGEIKNKKKDGSYYWVHAKVSPYYKNFTKIGYTAIREDITDRKLLETLSITDELTQIYNRRYFNQIFPIFIDVSKRNNELVNFVILDIDYFKQYNDTYGHQSGDNVLKEVSKTIYNSLKRANDYCFRLGGEEFGILFNSESKEKSVEFINKIRTNIEDLKIEHKKNTASDFITASFGLFFQKALDINNIDEVYKKADLRLYEAKKTGRNKVVSSTII